MAKEVNPRVARIDEDLERCRTRRQREEIRLESIDRQIAELEELRALELRAAAAEPAEPASSSET